MSDNKMMFGLPIAVLLGGSAIAFGVLPGVRDWVDQTVPWLGINGPKSSGSNVESIADGQAMGRDSSKVETLVLKPESTSVAVEPLQMPEPMKPSHEVEFAGGIALPSPPKVTASAPAQLPEVNNNVLLAQARSLEAVPPNGQYVPSRDNGALVVSGQAKFFDVSSVSAPAEGIITSLAVDEGSIVESGTLMIQLDSRLVEKEIQVSDREWHAAKLKAEDDSNVKFSAAAKEVAQQDVEISADLAARGAENYMEGVKKRLELKKAGFQVDVSKIEKLRDAADVEVKLAKLEAAKVQLALRKILAPRNGIVTDVVKRQGDWVRAGDVILKLTTTMKLRVEGNADLKDTPFAPHSLQGAPARVTIFYAKGKAETIDGIVNFVAPKTLAEYQYPVHVDIENRLAPDGQYLFRDGMNATIEITPRSR